ncbi:uncharacterized protein LACBIDRAFT_307144 [Laccaria bicolor S238N-H82]|uniref:Predicted protein n=1 Tax=Laccaria bicolor (strain S238N-H82 / ATCC MYA-4686) TaxID=486041 RepID=B0DPG4_LACBS|nr:uncharacterized protein LACBIDRAFT_307144 [Laccaria bicolor S238N-H82]EDR03448.1 predicted protein [Laccaria bicolor S238N-H82]|eukprot:XP_001885904.1 predicted protein [Laccaria bicolor S238N-H82]
MAGRGHGMATSRRRGHIIIQVSSNMTSLPLLFSHQKQGRRTVTTKGVVTVHIILGEHHDSLTHLLLTATWRPTKDEQQRLWTTNDEEGQQMTTTTTNDDECLPDNEP